MRGGGVAVANRPQHVVTAIARGLLGFVRAIGVAAETPLIFDIDRDVIVTTDSSRKQRYCVENRTTKQTRRMSRAD
jgi:hypothetical protein